MSETFETYRHKARRNCGILSVAFAVIAAAIGFSLSLLIQKAIGGGTGLVLPLVIGLGTLLLALAAGLLLTMPRAERLARSIDETHLGRERLQTMLAFADGEGDMLALQREDTEKRMERLPPPRIGWRVLTVLIAAAVLAAALFVWAWILPASAQGGSGGAGNESQDDEPFTFTEWQQARLRELIVYVQESALESGAKTVTVNELNTLYNDLFTVNTRAAMLQKVTAAMTRIDDKIEEVNTFEEIVGVFATSTDADLLALAKAIGNVTEIPDEPEMQALKRALAAAEDGYFSTLASKIEIDLTKLERYKSGELYAALMALANDLRLLDGALATTPDATAREILISATLDTAMTRLVTSAADQTENRNVGDTVILELMFIFDITESELPPTILDNGISYANPDGNYQERDDELSSEGGAGRDEMNYAGNDEVYDPDDDDTVQYGKIYKKYSAIMREKQAAGELPSEYEKFITDYFSALYSGD